VKFQWIDDERGPWPVEVLCEVLEVSRSGYYAWRARPESERAQRQQELLEAMQAIHAEKHKDSYGSPRMHQQLLARGFDVSENTVAALMKQHGMQASTKKKFRQTTDSNHPHPVAENLLDQAFEQEHPDQVWVSDITYIPTREGWLYLACVLDLYSRKVVGWSMSHSMTKDLVLSAMEMALLKRQPEADLMHHSDRGSQYASGAFQQVLKDENITCSMSRKGNCYDNAVMESFFASLKKELVHQADYKTRAEARQSIFEYIEVFYNQERLHSALGYVSPNEYERQYEQVA
jgi:transposase InsO family protein